MNGVLFIKALKSFVVFKIIARILARNETHRVFAMLTHDNRRGSPESIPLSLRCVCLNRHSTQVGRDEPSRTSEDAELGLLLLLVDWAFS
jgi:hypothetical protein